MLPRFVTIAIAAIAATSQTGCVGPMTTSTLWDEATAKRLSLKSVVGRICEPGRPTELVIRYSVQACPGWSHYVAVSLDWQETKRRVLGPASTRQRATSFPQKRIDKPKRA